NVETAGSGSHPAAFADAEKPVPNAETVVPPADAGSQPTTAHPGSDADTTPIPSTIAAPAADNAPGDPTANDKLDQLGAAIMAAPLPTPNLDQALVQPDPATIATPKPASDKQNANAEPSPAIAEELGPTPTPNSNQTKIETSPAVVATPQPTPTPNSGQ